MNPIPIGRLLRANTTGCDFGCKVTQGSTPSFGDMVLIPLTNQNQIYGLVYDIHIDDDGLVNQLAAADISREIIEDNRRNRNVPVEMSVAFIGWEDTQGKVHHTRVPYPPLTLDEIYQCDEEEVRKFTQDGSFGYLRAVLRNQELPAVDLVTAHLRQVLAARSGIDAEQALESSLVEVIAMLKDDYPQLMDVLSAVSEIL